MLLLLSVRLAATIYSAFRTYAPTNILLDLLRSRGLKWAIPVALVLVPAYLFGAAMATSLIDGGGSGWLNVVALVFIWNAIKFGAMSIWSVPLAALFRARSGRSRAHLGDGGSRETSRRRHEGRLSHD